MISFRTLCISAAAVVALTPISFAQNAPPASSSSPSSASSPHQRNATQQQAPEAPATNGANPAAASSPHQAEVTAGSQSKSTRSDAKQTMKSCMIREQADHSGMSQAEAKKSCKEQLKASPKS
jgi:hypothetical protein